MVVLSTTLGDITIELLEQESPISAANFLRYVDEGFYDGTIFHRVIPGFMVQGGGFTSAMQEKPNHDPIVNEADNGVHNTKGTLAMARTADVNSATSQFFINVANNTFLDHGTRDFGYAVFGRVTDGTDVVDQIVRVKTGRQGRHDDVPVTPIVIDSARRT